MLKTEIYRKDYLNKCPTNNGSDNICNKGNICQSKKTIILHTRDYQNIKKEVTNCV